MKRILTTKCIAAVCLAALTALPSLAQDSSVSTNKPNTDEAAMMAMMMEMAKPGENHKILEGMVGSWTYKVKYWVSPDTNTPPMESTGKTETKAVMDGRYFISNHTGKMSMPGADGKMADMEFRGMATDGYDNARKKFVSSWIDNMGTGIMMSEGTFDAGTKTLTYLSEEEALPGMKTKVRQTVTITDKNHHTMDFYEDRGGQEVKTMEIIYTRAR